MMQVLEELSCLRLDVLDADWVQGIYYSEFLEFGDFPAEYESILETLDVRKKFKRIVTSINEWLCSDEAEEDKTWAALSNHVPHQKLLAILAYYIDFGTKNVTTKEFRNNALLASRLYYKFMSVPGYKTYHIYHSQLFAHSLACLGYPKAMCDSEDKYLNTKELTNEVNSVIKELQHYVLDLRAIVEPLQLNPDDMNFEDILSNLVDITGGSIVNRLHVDKIELANISAVIYEIIDILLCNAEGEPDRTAIERLFKSIHPKLISASMDCKNATNIVRASYVTYSGLILSKYGKAAVSGYITLLQHLCCASEGLEKAEVRQARMSLVLGLMSMLPRKSYRNIVKWILKLSTVARVSHRQLALEMLYKLLCNDPEEETPRPAETVQQPVDPEILPPTDNENQTQLSTGDNTDNLKKQPPSDKDISNNDQTKAQELTKDDKTVEHPSVSESAKDSETNEMETSVTDATNDIANENLQNCEEASKSGNGSLTTAEKPSESEKQASLGETAELPIGDIVESPDFGDTMFDTISDLPNLGEVAKELSNIEETMEVHNDGNDTTNAVNTEDQTNVGDNSSKNKPNVGVANKTPPNNMAQASTPVNPPSTEDNSSQDSQEFEITEEDVAGLLRARAHTVPHGEVLRAVYARVNDAASTIRARAFYVLADCLVGENAPHNQAMRELNGDGPVSRLMAAAARGVCDERAAVRRAASALVHRSLALPSNPMPQADDLAILVGLSRDASIIVRSAAINYLGELAMQRPCVAVFDAWTTGPMHQLSDPETKVQELVMNMTQQILIDRLQKFTPGGAGNEDPIPWMFLDAITRHNMRQYLQKACLLLAKSASGINIRLVDISSTHLGTSDAMRDLHCLVLLTSVARHVDYNNVDFAIHYYYKLVNEKELQDTESRLMPLTLELLTAWARWMRHESRASLRDHVVERLAAAHDDGCRLQAVSLAAHLDPDNLIWATELMQLSQQRAVTGTDIDEWLRAADLSLVAPEPPSPALVRLFLNALTDPPSEWGEEQRGNCVAGCGRLCVRSRENAVLFAPHLAALLRDRRTPLPSRHNAVLILTDICTRYTCIVEPLLEDVCACLCVDSEPMIRRAAARSITKLLLSGYLRLRTPLYYRYCALLADEDHEVREPAEYYVTCSLPLDSIFHHFVDCIVYYNEESDNMSFDARQLVYDVMLQRMSMVQRLNLQCRIARDILEQAADITDEGDGELPASLNAALLDAITILCGPRMKLPKNKPQRDGDAADLEDLQERVTTNIVSHKMKCMVAEVLVPAVIRLNQRLQSKGGQVATYLLKIATDLFNDYQAEIEELMEDDQELMKRIQQFQETFAILDPSFGNSRNLVTASTTHDPETPRAPRKRPARQSRSPKKRALNI